MKSYFSTFILSALLLMSCTKNNGQGHQYTNELIHESSPYLLQHAHNPVDWYPWGEVGLTKAKEENKLLVISIGYSACHWCHVMEHECFEDSTVAAIMNESFLSVKVDREERPDIDQVYMEATHLMGQRGGWPLNIIALPNGKPFFSGTYFPKDKWIEILSYFQDLYIKDPQKIIDYSNQLTEGIQMNEMSLMSEEPSDFSDEQYQLISNQVLSMIDTKKGGFKGAPKFPMPSIYEMLMTQHYFLPNDETKQAIAVTLDEMANGGIYDHLGGGFARYSTDENWTVPHFEKMLYDNAQLISLYSHGYQMLGSAAYADAVRESIDFCNRELASPDGGYFSSLDADSEGEEGKFYVWKEKEIDQLLGKNTDVFKDYYGVTNFGNFEGKNVLERKKTTEELARKYKLSLQAISTSIANSKATLLKAREQRIRPALDDKILTSWNALMTMALVDGYNAFGEDQYLNDAIETAAFLLKNQVQKNGQIFRNHKEGKSSINGFLDDYALTILAFSKVYEVTFDEKWLKEANQIKQYVLEHFGDPKSQMFFYTSDLDEKLIARKMELTDNVIPSSNAIMAEALFRLGQYFANENDISRAKQMLHNMEASLSENPSSFSHWIKVYGLINKPYYEVAIVGEDARAKRNEMAKNFLPNVLFLGGKSEGSLELLKGKHREGKTMIYVCENKSCQLPTDKPERALKQIAR